MRKIKLIPLLLLFAGIQLFGQTKDSSVDELLILSSYPKDKDAGAIVVYDIGQSDFFDSDRGFYTKFTRTFRVKFFNDSELDFAEINIPLYENENEAELIKEFKATVYNMENGMILVSQTSKNELLKETYNKKVHNYKVAVAGVKAGSVMDVEYTIESPFFFNLQDWQFQYKIPVIYSEYVAKMVPFYTYSYIIKGTSKLDELSSTVETGLSNNLGNLSYQKTIYKFVKTNIPAFYDDPYITSENDYLISLDFQLSEINHTDGYKEKVMTTWPELNKGLLKDESFGIYLAKCGKLAKSIIETNNFPKTDKLSYVEQLVDFVKTNYDWDQFKGYMANCKPNNFIQVKKGNATAMNLFLTALLREAGFSADPVLISTRDNGKVYPKYPFLHYFNYTIALVTIDGKEYLLDATNKQGFFDQIPTRCINDIGLVVKKDEEKWVNLNSTTPSSETNSFQIQFNSNKDSLQYSFDCKASGYFALDDRISYKDNPEDFVEKEINPLFNEVIQSNVIEKDSLKLFDYSATGLVKPTQIDQYVSIKPFLNTITTVNPFTRKERNYPVDFVFARKRSFSALIILPQGAKLVKQPESFKMDNLNFGLNYEVSISDNTIIVKADYNLKKPVYDPTLYPGLRIMYENLIKYLNQNIEIQL